MSDPGVLAGLPVDALVYEGALLILGAAFLLYALVLRELLALVDRRFFWLLPVAGALLLVGSAVTHGFAAIVLAPLIPMDPAIFRETLLLRTASLGCLMGCGVLGLIGGLAYLHEMGD